MPTPPKINGDKMRRLIDEAILDNGESITLVAEILTNLTDADTAVFRHAGQLLKVLRGQQEKLHVAQAIAQASNRKKRVQSKRKD